MSAPEASPPTDSRAPITTYWFVFVWGDVDPEVRGPFPSDEARDAEAQTYRRDEQRGDDENGCYWLDVTNGVPLIGSYSGAFFMDDDDDE